MQYSCSADWNIKTNYLRCNPSFHGNPRYDCVLINSNPNPYFARIISLFTCQVGGHDYPLALILPFSSVYMHRNRRRKDIDFELLRLRENFRKDHEIVSINTFIRGAVIVESGEPPNSLGFDSQDHFLFDLLDTDIFLRGRAEIERCVFTLFLSILSRTVDR